MKLKLFGPDAPSSFQCEHQKRHLCNLIESYAARWKISDEELAERLNLDIFTMSELLVGNSEPFLMEELEHYWRLLVHGEIEDDESR